MGFLRFYLALCVVMAHVASFPFPIGINPQCAVMIFFIISGFYMTMILNTTYQGKGSLFAFFFNRFFRLWPIFIIITICSMIAPYVLSHYGDNPNNWIWPALSHGGSSFWASLCILFSNVFMLFHDWQFYFSRDISQGFSLISGFKGGLDLSVYDYVPQAWSIGVEISFYLVAPLIVRNIRIILLVMMISLLINLYWIHVGARFEPWRYMFLPSVLYLFMLGAAAYHLFYKYSLKSLNLKDILLTIITITIFVFVSNKVNADRPLYIAFAPVEFIKYALAIPILFFITKNWKVDRFIGELSYSLYLSHLLVLHTTKALLPAEIVGNGVLVIVISILFSIVLVLAVDYPINNWRHKMSKRLIKDRKEENELGITVAPVIS